MSTKKGETMAKLEKRIVTQDFETVAVYSENGSLLFEKGGNKNSVIFSDKEVSQMKGAVLTHNHPTGYSFSKDDIITLNTSGLSEIRAIGNEYLYTMKNTHPELKERTVDRIYDRARRKVLAEYTARQDFSSPMNFYHDVIVEFSEQTGLEYKRVKRK